MLDVHPPHSPTHTWKDFFIHIATICVGLLIAIGLEQTVEAIHHHHQRRDLEAQLHEEAQHNLSLVQGNIARLEVQLAWEQASIVALNSAPVSAGRIPFSVIPPVGTVFDVGLFEPSQATWAVAKANGSVALLPEEEAQVYARLDHEGDLLQKGGIDLLQSLMQSRGAYDSRSGLPNSQSAWLSLDQRDALVHTFADLRAHTRWVLILELNERGACQGILQGANSVDQMLQFMLRDYSQYKAQHPQLF
ncbi:MAG: hypothetical protein V4555_11645 [Acidobacteriota bacterium]